MNYHWNWSIFWEPSPEGNGTYFDMLLSGLVTTLVTAAGSWVLSFLIGSGVGIARTLPGRVPRLVANSWIELFRNVPLLVQLFLWYFVLPEFLPKAAGTWLKQLPNASFYTAVVGIGCYMSARMAVQLSAGIGALSSGQRAAGTALGLTTAQTYRYVLLPAAYRIIMPPMTTDVLATLKNTSVALTIGLAELTSRARSMQEFSFQVFEAYAAATAAYCLISLAVTAAARLMERRMVTPGHGSAT
jgi:glutamate/aspartate transport system permease protein